MSTVAAGDKYVRRRIRPLQPRCRAFRLPYVKPSRVVLSFALLLVVAGCAGGSTTTPGPEATGSGVSSNSDETPSGSSGRPVSPSAAPEPSSRPVEVPPEVEDLTLLPTKGGATLTLTGIPTAGVEARCWLLDGYLLIGVPTNLLGTDLRITVTGRAEPDLMTTCQQGIPLQVENASLA